MFRFRSSLVAALCLVAAGSAVRAAEFTNLVDGDRVVFYGDSITQQRLYTTYLEEYVRCRYRDLKLSFFTAGWNGDTAAGALARLDRDVMPLKPTVVTLFFGMNDGGYQPPNELITANYKTSLDKLITALQAAKVRVIVFSPGCVDYDRNPILKKNDYNKTLEGLAAVAEELAKQHDCQFVDVFHPMLKFQTEQKAKEPGFTISLDGVHPSEAGHLVMVRQMVPTLAESNPSVDAGKSETPATADAAFVVKTKAVPFYVSPDAVPAARACGMLDYAADQLKVPDLPKGDYQLTVDGTIAASESADDLAAGKPIAAPASKRGQRLHDLIIAKNENYFAAWRNIRLPMSDLASAGSLYDAMLKADDAFNAAIIDLTTNTESTIELLPQPMGPNLALNKPYVCNDPNPHGWNSGLTDGSWQAEPGHCFATNDGATFPKTVTIDLGEPKPVGSVIVGVPQFGATKTIRVAVSEDGKSFTDIGTHEFKQLAAEKFTYSPSATVQGRYVRLTYPDHYETPAGFPVNFVFTAEVEVYSKK
ncbi:MAG: GDSL-type esterase/lipase family protein [Tepidisphaeraceae bacterium]